VDGKAHRRHPFFFRHPPTREDFLQVCEQLPWTSVWQTTLFPILATHPWPMIDYMHKSAGVELFDQSKLVGRVNVYREDRWENKKVVVPAIYEEIGEITRRCKDKEAARRYVEGRRYEIMENVAKGDMSIWPENVAKEIRRVLVEGGFLKGRKRKTLTPTQVS
jgi:N-methylhydantoinase A/oxoprolinase/acetone carboxylase beta subunit